MRENMQPQMHEDSEPLNVDGNDGERGYDNATSPREGRTSEVHRPKPLPRWTGRWDGMQINRPMGWDANQSADGMGWA
jgi:hypothetical protein